MFKINHFQYLQPQERDISITKLKAVLRIINRKRSFSSNLQKKLYKTIIFKSKHKNYVSRLIIFIILKEMH